MSEPSTDAPRRGFLRSLGPAIIMASVVLGPGSILTNSKVGCQFGYSMIWVLAATGILMVGMTAMAARLGVTLEGTLCDELTRRVGRPLAALAGVSLCLIAACFQFGNNLGVLAAIEPFVKPGPAWSVSVLVLLNGAIVAALYGLGRLYKPVERMMMFLVMLMIIGFAGNLFLAQPSLLAVLAGLVPQVPANVVDGLVPYVEDNTIIDPVLALQGLIATTFSVGGVFYQSYLVREKGWTTDNLRQGFVDSVAGISVLCGISLMIMVTSAAVLHGTVDPAKLNSATEVARQLEPLFGRSATVLFCLGIFAGAFSSFLVNAMVGGIMLSDGIGLGGRMDQPWPKLFTVGVLFMGMVVAIVVTRTGRPPVNLIVFAQALTVLGVPVLALSLLYLATRPDLAGPRKIPVWMKVIAAAGCLVSIGLALRIAWRIYLQLGLS